jgi:hypothetical protein
MRQRARPRGRIIKSLDGPPCPGCGCATEVRKYERIGPKQLMRPLYDTNHARGVQSAEPRSPKRQRIAVLER